MSTADVVVLAERRALRRRDAVPAVAPTGGPGARWVSRLASALSPPLLAEVRSLAARETGTTDLLAAEPPLDARGLPVLLVGGMASTPALLQPLHDWLVHLGARPTVPPIRYGVDCGERTAERLVDARERTAGATGERCLVLAHSRGGQFARAAAVRRPELVRGLVTLGSPLNRMLGVHPLLKAEVAVLGVAGSLGVPGLLRAGCLWGECCRALRRDLAAPFPAEVPFVSIFSRLDHLVDWRSCLDPAARHREVRATHSGLLSSPAAYAVLAEELAQMVAEMVGESAPVSAQGVAGLVPRQRARDGAERVVSIRSRR
jgi:triacylglycerol lipase